MKSIDLSRGMVFVTGGGGSIGRAIAVEAARAGAAVAVVDRSLEPALATVSEIGAIGGRAMALECNVTDEKALSEAMKEAVSELGQMVGLVTAAAILRIASVTEQSEEAWRDMMTVNVEGTFKAIKAAVPHLENTGGSIVTLGSVSAFIGSDEGIAYTTTKGAVLSMTYAAAGDLAGKGIRVNAVSPGWVDGGFTHQAMATMDNPDELASTAKRLHYLGRLATPTDVANAAVWLLSDQAAFVTGTSLLVDGGYMINHS